MSKAAIQILKITKMNSVFMLLFVFTALILNPDTVQAGYTGPQRTPAATVSITLSCAFQNGWCRNGGNAVITGYDPLYAIVAIEGSNSGNGFSCSSASCTIPLHEGANQILAWSVSSFGDTSVNYRIEYILNPLENIQWKVPLKKAFLSFAIFILICAIFIYALA